MIIIDGLEKIPKECAPWDCPCFQPATMDGPDYCCIRAMITGSAFTAAPKPELCPLRKVSDS